MLDLLRVEWVGPQWLAAAQFRFGGRQSALHFQTPLRQSRVMVRLEWFDGKPRGFDRGRCDGPEKSIGDCLLDPHSADVETGHAACLITIVAATLIRRIRAPAAIPNSSAAATVPPRDWPR